MVPIGIMTGKIVNMNKCDTHIEIDLAIEY